jgi:hypothetical protein
MLTPNTAHKATQTIKDTLHTPNTTHKKSKAIPATGLLGFNPKECFKISVNLRHKWLSISIRSRDFSVRHRVKKILCQLSQGLLSTCMKR